MVYTHIIHVSDIHIRHELDRFEEYSSVFDTTFNLIKKQVNENKSLIVCTGDLIHNKVRITPVVIYLVNKFLKGLSDIGDVVLIDGNHDINVGNESEKRLLEVIKKPENINYISQTGEYVFDNITIGASTLVDNNFIKYEDIENKQDMTIAIGHFTLKEWLDERGIPAMTRVKCVKDFEGYKHVLLGDIHSRKSYENCRYAGSLVSQNFSETGKHGFSVLNVVKNKWKKIEVPSNYSFVNLNVDNEGILQELTQDMFTTYSYIKLSIPPKFIDKEVEYRKEISQFTEIRRFMKNIDSQNISLFKTDNDTTIEDREMESLPLNEEQIIKLIIGDDNNIDKIMDLHKKFKGDGFNYSQNVCKWYLKKMSFENILKYRGTHTLQFDELNGIIGISGLNASGKSSLLKILIFGLSGEISVDFSLVNSDFSKASQSYNHYKFDTINILNYDSPIVKRGFIEIEFIYDKTDYKIHRFIERKGTSLSTNTTLSQLKKGKWEVICSSLPKCKSRITEKEVNKRIYNMIGRSSDLFLLNVINKNSGSIVDVSDVGRFNIFSNIFNLNIYNDIATRVKTRIQEVKDEIQKYKGKKEYASAPLNTITNFDYSEVTETIRNKEREKKILEMIKNNTITTDDEPVLLETSSEKLKSQFDTLVATKNKLIKQIEKNIPDGEQVKPEASLSQSVIINKYKDISNTKDVTIDLSSYLGMSDLPKPYKTDVTEEKVNELNSQLIDYNYDIEEILSSEDRLRGVLAKFGEKVIHTPPSINGKEIDFSRFDVNAKRESFDADIIPRNINIRRLETEKSSIKILQLIHIHSKRTNPDNKEELDEILNNSMKDIRNLTNIDDIIESLSKGQLKRSYIKRLEELRGIETTMLKVCDIVSETNKRLQKLEEDIKYNKQIEEDIEYNKDMNKKIERVKEIDTIINEYNKKKHNEVLDNLKPLFVEINRRLSYIKLYKNYEELKTKYLQNIAYLINQKEKYKKKLEYESYIRYYNYKIQEDIHEIDKMFNNINHTVNNRTNILYKEISNLQNEVDARKSVEVIDVNLDALREENELLSIYSKLIKEDIKITILSKYLHQVVEFINDILVNLVNFTIDLTVNADISDKTNRIKLNIIRNNTTGAYSLSAYEEFVLNLVSKIVLNIYNNNATATFLVLDECLECVDYENRTKIEALFNMIKKRYQHILLITHIEEYYHMCNKNIKVNNGEFNEVRGIGFQLHSEAYVI